MRHGWKKTLGSAVSLIVLIALMVVLGANLSVFVNGSERFFSGDAEDYYQELLAAGFPSDYAVSLTELHLLHPAWSFQPLLVTKDEPTYTWDYVIDKEVEDGELNVVYSSATYSVYHHPTNRELYDAGYYQASRPTVEYFMDPRNFLNETDIFQFYSQAGGEHATLSAVEAVLENTFMENERLENDLTYAEYFLVLGQQLQIDPVFLATKVRQEQGTKGTSPIISGTCGDKLADYLQNNTQENDDGDPVLTPTDGSRTEQEVLELNGLYNYFNVGATGKGLFSIYYNAMQYAKRGTTDMAEEWGGSPSWNTREKALYGGAYFLKTKYIDAYQPTAYLQKFNVDSRAKNNFQYQYMTSVFGALSEGRTLYQSFSALNTLDSPASFLIPVYAEMPTDPCADPAGGAVSSFAQTMSRTSFENTLTLPKHLIAQNSVLYAECESYAGTALRVTGETSHTYDVKDLEYAWDGGEWQSASENHILNLSLDLHFSDHDLHILTVRGHTVRTASGKLNGQTLHGYHLVAVLYVRLVPPPSVTLSLRMGDTLTQQTLLLGDSVQLPACTDPSFAGWSAPDGRLFPSEAELLLEDDLTLSAFFIDFQPIEGAALAIDEKTPTHLRFSTCLPKVDYNRLAAFSATPLVLGAQLEENGERLDRTVKRVSTESYNGTPFYRLDMETEALESSDFETLYTASFFIQFSYTNGDVGTISPKGISVTRSPREVALSALSDRTVTYPAQAVQRLQTVAGIS